MEYNLNSLDKIINFKTWSVKQKVDELLRIDCNIHCNLGTDSTKQERLEARRNSRKIYVNIKKVNPAMGNMFLQNIDKEK